MPDGALTPARERLLARARADNIQRGVASVHLALADLPDNDKLIALNEVVVELLGRPRPRQVYLVIERTRVRA